jgi:hypothetical protein
MAYFPCKSVSARQPCASLTAPRHTILDEVQNAEKRQQAPPLPPLQSAEQAWRTV